MDTDTAELLKRIALGEDSVLKLKTVEFRCARVMGPHKDGIADEQGTERNAAFETGSHPRRGPPISASRR
jgi:hypothetical protein